MAYSIRRTASHNKESRVAEQLGKMLTQDFAVDLERVGFYVVRNLPLINYHRLEVLSLTAMEEYDKLMEEMKKGNPYDYRNSR
jgi:hypothetical protein